MHASRTYWPAWIDSLRRLGLEGFAIWLLEGGGPVAVLGAQALYLSEPFISSSASTEIRALANLLEQEDESRAFTALLKGKTQ
jgi:hypothetical protein